MYTHLKIEYRSNSKQKEEFILDLNELECKDFLSSLSTKDFVFIRHKGIKTSTILNTTTIKSVKCSSDLILDYKSKYTEYWSLLFNDFQKIEAICKEE